MTRRDLCYLVGKRARRMNRTEAARAWRALAEGLECELAGRDMPKFNDILDTIRSATIKGKTPAKSVEIQ